MALKAGRVGLHPSQVDKNGMVIGGGGSSFLHGEDAPTSDLGNDKQIYFKTQPYGWLCNEDYYVNDARTLFGSLQKKNAVPAIGFTVHGGGWYGPGLISDNPDGVLYSSNDTPNAYTFEYGGITWYTSTTNHWQQFEATHSQPIIEISSATWTTDENMLMIFETVGLSIFDEPFITDSYVKVNGVWQALNGSKLSDVI